MSLFEVLIDPRWDSFREEARSLIRQHVHPERVRWVERGAGSEQLGLLADASPPPAPSAESTVHVPRRFHELGESVACHRDPAPWDLLYRVLWRITAGERALLDDPADPETVIVQAMHRAVRRDAHKMTAFVRFRAVQDGDGERYVAWFEPKHRIVRRTAGFFEKRFPSMRWSILTPDESVHWDGETLRFTAGVTRDQAPAEDAWESFWLTYYGHTFNPARVRISAMRAEMPVFYWRNLPEASQITTLLTEAPRRVQAMLEAAATPPRKTGGRVQPTDLKDERRHPSGGAPQVMAAPTVANPPTMLVPPAELKPIRTPRVRIGVAGWDYPDWAGRVYPEGRRGIDRLRWVSAQVDLIEVNSTFYRPASRRVVQGWLERTADRPELRFAAKLLRGFTHDASLWRDADARAVREGLNPLLESGRLTSLLVQFPWSFRNQPESRRRLRRIIDAFSEFPLHVEVRHASWDQEPFRAWLSERGVGLVNLDQPMFADSIAPAAHATARTAYLRLHGRNSANWFRAEATRDEQYDYLYSAEELQPWVNRAVELSNREDVDEVEVVFNNHYRGQAVDNARLFGRMLAEASTRGAAIEAAGQFQTLPATSSVAAASSSA